MGQWEQTYGQQSGRNHQVRSSLQRCVWKATEFWITKILGERERELQPTVIEQRSSYHTSRTASLRLILWMKLSFIILHVHCMFFGWCVLYMSVLIQYIEMKFDGFFLYNLVLYLLFSLTLKFWMKLGHESFLAFQTRYAT